MSISNNLSGKEYSELDPFVSDLETGTNELINGALIPVNDEIANLKQEIETLKGEVSTLQQELSSLGETVSNIPTGGTGTTPTTTAEPTTGDGGTSTPASEPLSITTTELAPAVRFSPYNLENRGNSQVEATGGVEPYTFTFQPSLNPLDLTIDSGGNISGFIDKLPGNYLTRVLVEDVEGNRAFKDYTISVVSS